MVAVIRDSAVVRVIRVVGVMRVLHIGELTRNHVVLARHLGVWLVGGCGVLVLGVSGGQVGWCGWVVWVWCEWTWEWVWVWVRVVSACYRSIDGGHAQRV